MFELIDEKNSIRWIGSDLENIEDIAINKKNREILNTWQSENISANFSSESLGDRFTEIIEMMNKCSSIKPTHFIYYAYSDNKLVGATIVMNNSSILNYYHLPESNESINSNNKSLHIETIVVNPKEQNKGYATRMIKSITENTQIFSMGNKVSSVTASIHNSNLPSIKAHLKNGFEIIKPIKNYSYLSGFDTYFCTPKDRERTN